jgi:hypothetical protein
VLFIRETDLDKSVNILRNQIREYLSNPPDSRFQNSETKYVLPTFVAADKRKTKYKEHPSDRSAHHRRDTSHGVKKIIERLLHSKTATANGDEEEKNGDGGNNV